VAGKSGTAETGTPDPHAWFPAYAPADAPTISIATILPNIPLGTGGSDAAPLVRQVMAVHFANCRMRARLAPNVTERVASVGPLLC